MILRPILAMLFSITGLVISPTSWAQAEQRTPLLGDPAGGDPGEWRCPKHAYLVGFEARTSSEGFHALSPVCAEYQADGTRGKLTQGPRFGGMAGEPVTKLCPASKPFVRTMQAMTVTGKISILSVFFECGPMTGSFGPTKPDETYLSFHGGSDSIGTGEIHFPSKKAILCPAGYGYAGIHAQSNYDLDAIGAICQTATPVTRVQSVGKKPIPQAPPIRNPADSTTVLSRTTGPTVVQQSAAATAILPTPQQQAHTVVNSAAADISRRIEANQMICRGGPTLGVHPA